MAFFELYQKIFGYITIKNLSNIISCINLQNKLLSKRYKKNNKQINLSRRVQIFHSIPNHMLHFDSSSNRDTFKTNINIFPTTKWHTNVFSINSFNFDILIHGDNIIGPCTFTTLMICVMCISLKQPAHFKTRGFFSQMYDRSKLLRIRT